MFLQHNRISGKIFTWLTPKGKLPIFETNKGKTPIRFLIIGFSVFEPSSNSFSKQGSSYLPVQIVLNQRTWCPKCVLSISLSNFTCFMYHIGRASLQGFGIGTIEAQVVTYLVDVLTIPQCGRFHFISNVASFFLS